MYRDVPPHAGEIYVGAPAAEFSAACGKDDLRSRRKTGWRGKAKKYAVLLDPAPL